MSFVSSFFKSTESSVGGVKSTHTAEGAGTVHARNLKRVVHVSALLCAHSVLAMATSDQETTFPSTKPVDALSTSLVSITSQTSAVHDVDVGVLTLTSPATLAS